MTGAELISGVRFLLGDSERRSSTSSRRYGDPSIARTINNCQTETLKLLIIRAREEERRKRPSITISRMSKEAPAKDGIDDARVPTDYMQLECGYTNAGVYCPAQTLPLGRHHMNFSFEHIYCDGNYFHGSADVAVYWSLPSEIKNSDVPLTEFSDAFYNTVKLGACRDILVQDGRGVAKRYLFFHQRYSQRLMSLR